MEIQRIVWYWDSLLDRLAASEQDLSSTLRRSCRPLEAERRADGWLTLAVGCWWRADLAHLSHESQRERLNRVMGRMLEDHLSVVFVAWPGGLAERLISEDEIETPDILAGLPPQAREEAASCESPIQRYFYAQAYRRGLRPRCQYATLGYRLDFAFPEQRAAVEVVGWEWHRLGRGAGMPREREERFGTENWRVRWFSGTQVLNDAEGCLAELDALLKGGTGLFTREMRQPRKGNVDPRSWPRYERRPPRHR